MFVRGVPGGTLEQVVLRLDFLHALKLLGVPVYNDGRAIERTVDKAMTSFVLANAGIPTPATWVTESEARHVAVVRAETARGRELVIKPLFGSQGAGLKRINCAGDLPPRRRYDGVYYLQRYIESGSEGWHDWRVFVIDAVGGGGHEPARQELDHERLAGRHLRCRRFVGTRRSALARAETPVRALQMDYAGVDLIRDREGRLHVIEVNGIPAWKGLQSVSRDNIAQRLVNDFVDRHLRRPALHSVA